jgi:hypothetical protein
VRLLHALAKTVASFDDPHLVSHAGLVPMMALAERAGLGELVAEHVRPGGDCGVNAHLKVPALVAGMAAGADSIDDMDVLRHGAMGTLFGGIRAPSTPGSHLRPFTWGNVSQLEKAGREFLAELARRAPLLPGADVLAFVDIDSMQKRVYGHAKQGAKFGHTKIQGKSVLVRGLNALAAVISTPIAAPVIAATRLRGGNAGSARGAASLAVQAIGTARDCGCTGTIIVRMDSAYCNASVVGAIRRQGARFSATVPMNSSVRAAIAAIGEDAWTAIRYPQAIWDDQLDCRISDAEVAETGYTAFTSREKGQAVTARLIVRRVRDQNGKAAHGQDELYPPLATPRRAHRLPVRDRPGRGAAPRPRRRRAGLRRRHQRPARAPAIRRFRRECRVAVDRGHGAQPGPRGRLPGQPHVREGPRRDRPPRPDRRRRPHRPPRTRQPHPPPARRMAPRAGMDDPAGRGLRPARRSGLTSPEQVTHPDGPQATPNPSPRARNHGQAAEHASGRKTTPRSRPKPGCPLTAAPDNGRWIEA